MANIQDILTINLDEEIKAVIDLASQDEQDVIDELDGFILTESLAKHLTDFCDEYLNGSIESGVWLSGFYGSGKSYFAKMLGFLLKNPTLKGTSMRKRFIPKITGLPDANLIENTVNSLDRIKSHVVLFDAAKNNTELGLAYMAFANFLRSLGLMDNWIGIIEYNLLLDGRYEELLQTVQANEGKSWHELKLNMTTSVKAFKKALLSMGYSEDDYDETRKLAVAHRKEYDATKLAEDLQRYLAIKSDIRIVFMIDEVSEAINQKKINLLDLEGFAEALAALKRRVWTIAIAQLKLDDVVSAQNLSHNLLNKLRDRFRIKVDIKADEVDVIIKQRLLAKTDQARIELKAYFSQKSGAIRDITNLQGLNLRPTSTAENYADYYPFYEYQFRMLQYFLFGSGTTVQTKMAARGMIISAFDVLKKEVKLNYQEHANVTATQLCNQAEEATEDSQRARYEQATNALKPQGYKYVEGKKLLQAIYFIAKTTVTKTTVENICRAYVDTPDLYYDVLDEIKKALDLLVENNIVMLTGDQYRITNQIEERIMQEMKDYDVPQFIITGEITKQLKTLQLIRDIQSTNVEGLNVPFSIKLDDGQSISNNGENNLKVILQDINRSADRSKRIAEIKDESQSHKDTLYIVPNIDELNQINSLVTDLKRIAFITEKTYSTDEEKRVVDAIKSSQNEKQTLLIECLRRAYAEGTSIYQYNTYELNDSVFSETIKSRQREIFDNIFTKRLSMQLPESIAPKVIAAQPSQLHNLFGGAPDFAFFDTSGKFVGTSLSIVIEILAKASSFTLGSELERQLSAPPTGYNIGSIMVAVAALFRGNKIIARYGGTDYNSVNTDGCRDIFQNARNFSKASFKAIAENLTYNERQEIIDILKDDCEYRSWIGSSLTYQLNDFDVVDSVRTLSKEIISRINHDIISDPKKEQLFTGSKQAAEVFREFTAAVNETNCLSQARKFLDMQDDFIAAVERVKKDLNFIKNNFTEIESIKEYLGELHDEIQSAECDLAEINTLSGQFKQCYENNVVSNYGIIQQLAQKARDHYFALFKEKAEAVTAIYQALVLKVDDFAAELNKYPKEWNEKLYKQLGELREHCNRNIIDPTRISIGQFSVQCRNCSKTLRDLVYAANIAQQKEQDIAVMRTEIKTEAPLPKPQPKPGGGGPKPQPKPQPTKRNMRSQLPTGMKSVAQYRAWLTAQLQMLLNFGEADELDFNN